MHTDVSAILVISEVQEDVMVPRFPGSLLLPLRELGFVPNVMIVRATLSRFGSNFYPARRFCKGPD
eukprot:15034948-Heterocapsa_arctica.AAC.1